MMGKKIKINWQGRWVKIAAFLIFFAGLGVFLFSLYFLPPVYNNRYLQALRYERMAKKLPPTNQMAIKLRAMAKALREGENEYSYTINALSPTPSFQPTTTSNSNLNKDK